MEKNLLKKWRDDSVLLPIDTDFHHFAWVGLVLWRREQRTMRLDKPTFMVLYINVQFMTDIYFDKKTIQNMQRYSTDRLSETTVQDRSYSLE